MILTAVGTDQRAVGREAAVRQMRDIHERAFDADQISALRIYFPMALLTEQLTG